VTLCEQQNDGAEKKVVSSSGAFHAQRHVLREEEKKEKPVKRVIERNVAD